MLPNTVVDLIRSLDSVPRERALHFHHGGPDETVLVPYCEMNGLIRAYMAALRAEGIGPGTRVILPFETDERVLYMFLALIGIGALPLSIKPYLFAGGKEAYVEFLRVMVRRFNVDRIVRTDSLIGMILPAPDLALQTFTSPAGASDESVFHEVSPEDVAFVQFSSGTTTFPKGVPIRHDRFITNMVRINDNDGRRDDDVGSSWLPLYHDMGLIGGLLCSFIRPNTVHLYTPVQYLMDPIGWLRELGIHRVTGSVTPNFGIDYALRYLREADSDELAGLDLSRLRVFYNGSEPINMAGVDEFCEILAPYGLRRSVIQPCYGMAEAVLMVSADRNGPRTCELAGGGSAVCVGEPLPGFSLRIITEDGRLAEDGELGEIELSDGTLADRYFETDRALINDRGYYATGDFGVTVDGALYITGRIGDRMKINGQSYFASAFEQALDALSFIRTGRTAVFQTGDRVIVLAEVQNARAVWRHRHHHQHQVVNRLFDQTGVKVHHQDVHFIRYGGIRKTSSGKLRRQAIATAHRAGSIRESGLPGYLWDRIQMRASRVIRSLALGLRTGPRRARAAR